MANDPIVYSGEWWRSRTDEQLEEQLRGSFPGGAAFDGATAEINKRTASKKEARDRRIAVLGLFVAVVAALAAVVALFRPS
jgi:hypothetical protein